MISAPRMLAKFTAKDVFPVAVGPKMVINGKFAFISLFGLMLMLLRK